MVINFNLFIYFNNINNNNLFYSLNCNFINIILFRLLNNNNYNNLFYLLKCNYSIQTIDCAIMSIIM